MWLSRWLNGNYTRRELEKKHDACDSGTLDTLFKTEAQDRIKICYEQQRKNLMKERCAENEKEEKNLCYCNAGKTSQKSTSIGFVQQLKKAAVGAKILAQIHYKTYFLGYSRLECKWGLENCFQV
jgi:hypothetical protein